MTSLAFPLAGFDAEENCRKTSRAKVKENHLRRLPVHDFEERQKKDRNSAMFANFY